MNSGVGPVVEARMMRLLLLLVTGLCACTSRAADPAPDASASGSATVASAPTPLALQVEVGHDSALRGADNVRSYAVEPIDVVEVRSAAGGLQVRGLRRGDAQITLSGRDERRHVVVVTVVEATSAVVAVVASAPSAVAPVSAPAKKPRSSTSSSHDPYGF